MKKIIATLIISLLAATFTLAACTLGGTTANGGGQNETGDGNTQQNTANEGGTVQNGHSIVYVFTADGNVTDIDENTTMYDYMCALKEDGDLVFEGENGDYGFFVNSVMGIGPKVVSSTPNFYSGWSWTVYTSITTLDGVIYSEEASFTFDRVSLHRAIYGVSGLPCVEGESYALVYEYSEMSF